MDSKYSGSINMWNRFNDNTFGGNGGTNGWGSRVNDIIMNATQKY
jgi:hypothetical protein